MPVRSLVAAVERGRSIEHEIGRETPEMTQLSAFTTITSNSSPANSPQFSHREPSQHTQSSIHPPPMHSTTTTSHDSPSHLVRSTATTSSSTHEHSEYPIPHLTSIMGGSRDDASTNGVASSNTLRVGSLINDDETAALTPPIAATRIAQRETNSIIVDANGRREVSKDERELSYDTSGPLDSLPNPFAATRGLRQSINPNDEMGDASIRNNTSLGTAVYRQSHISGASPSVNNNSNTLMPPRVPSPTGTDDSKKSLINSNNNFHINQPNSHARANNNNVNANELSLTAPTVAGGSNNGDGVPSLDSVAATLPMAISSLPQYEAFREPESRIHHHMANAVSSEGTSASGMGGPSARQAHQLATARDKSFHPPVVSSSYLSMSGESTSLGHSAHNMPPLGIQSSGAAVYHHPPYALSMAYPQHSHPINNRDLSHTANNGSSSPNTIGNSPRSATSIRGVQSHTGDNASLASSLTGETVTRVVVGKHSSPTPEDGSNHHHHDFGLPTPAPNTHQSFRSFMSNSNIPPVHPHPQLSGGANPSGIHPSWAKEPVSNRGTPSPANFRNNRRASIEEGYNYPVTSRSNNYYFSSTNNNNFSLTNPSATELQDSFVGQWVKGNAVMPPGGSVNRFAFGEVNASSVSEMHFSLGKDARELSKEKGSDSGGFAQRKNSDRKEKTLKGLMLASRSSSENISDFLAQYMSLKSSFWGDTSVTTVGAQALKQYEQLDTNRSKVFGLRLMTLVENFCLKASEDDEGTMNIYRFDSFRQTASSALPPDVFTAGMESNTMEPSSAGPSTARVTFRDSNYHSKENSNTGATTPANVASPTSPNPIYYSGTAGNNGSMSSRSVNPFRGVGFLSEDNLTTNFKSQKAVKKILAGRPNSAETTISTASALMANVDETNIVKKSTDDAGFATINQYAIVMPIGKGTQGKVKLVSNESGETFAMKIVPKSLLRRAMLARLEEEELIDGGSPTKRLLSGIDHEIAVMKKVRHKNIIALYEVIDDPGSKYLYLIMQYADKGPVVKIDPKTLTCKPLDAAIAAKYLRQLVTGLRYLHRKKIIHRDIKPDNMLVTGDHTICIADFGVSEMLENSSAIRGILGTHIFFPPEMLQAKGADEMYGPAVDVWALGVSAFFMVFGCSPFIGATPDDITKKIINCEIQYPPQCESNPEMWKDWKEIFEAIFTKDPAQRILLRDLKDLRLLRGLDMDGNERPKTLITITKNYEAMADGAGSGSAKQHHHHLHQSAGGKNAHLDKGPLHSRDDESNNSTNKSNSTSDPNTNSNTNLSASGSTAAPNIRNSNSDHSEEGGSGSSNNGLDIAIGSRPPPKRKATMVGGSDDDGDFAQTIYITNEDLKAAVRTVPAFMGGDAALQLTSPTSATPPTPAFELRSPNPSAATTAPPPFENSVRFPLSVHAFEGSANTVNNASLIGESMDSPKLPLGPPPTVTGIATTDASPRSISVLALALKGQQAEERRSSQSPDLGPATMAATVPSPPTAYASPTAMAPNQAMPTSIPARAVSSPTPPTSKQPLHMRPASPSFTLSTSNSKGSYQGSNSNSNNTSGSTTHGNLKEHNTNTNTIAITPGAPPTMAAIPTVSATGTSEASTPNGSPVTRRLYAGASPDMDPIGGTLSPNPRNIYRPAQGVAGSGIGFGHATPTPSGTGNTSNSGGLILGGGTMGTGLQKPKVGVYSTASVPQQQSFSPGRHKEDTLRKNQSHGALLTNKVGGGGGGATSIGMGFNGISHNPVNSSPLGGPNNNGGGATFGIRGLLHSKGSKDEQGTPRQSGRVNQSFSFLTPQQQAEAASKGASSNPAPRGISVPSALHPHHLLSSPTTNQTLLGIDADNLDSSVPIVDSNGNSWAGFVGAGVTLVAGAGTIVVPGGSNSANSGLMRAGSSSGSKGSGPPTHPHHLPEIVSSSRPTSGSGVRVASVGGNNESINLAPLPIKRASVTSFDAAAGNSTNGTLVHHQGHTSSGAPAPSTPTSSPTANTNTNSVSSPLSNRELSKPRTSLFANRVNGAATTSASLSSPLGSSQDGSPTSLPKPRHLPKLTN